MQYNERPRTESAVRTVFTAMWRNWALAAGAIIFPILCALFLKRIWIPFVCFAEIYTLTMLSRSDSFRGLGACSLTVRVAVRILVIAAIAMLGIDILCTDFLIPTVVHLELYNQEIPFITSLVVFPATAIMCGFTLLSGTFDGACRDCRHFNSFYAGDSIIGTVYFREARYQITILLLLSLLLGGVEYWYYFARYINSNFNNPDRFFFIYMPAVVYGVSLIVMGARYANMYALYMAVDDARPDRANTTRVRFLVFCENDLLLHMGENGQWDTPVETIVSRRNAIDDEEARLMFTELTSLNDFTLRYCYTGEDIADGANTIHFAVFVAAEQSVAVGSKEDRWFNPYMLDCGLQSGTIAGTLANELYRIHTITMAWKTYDRHGHRLYPIKHYRPTFRFGDMPTWKVDYDDTSWFTVAYNNEDRHFFRLRALWNRITGILDRHSQP